jgi:filamentous hemagglutinin family protein
MNHVYRIIWSQARNAWIAVSENTKGREKSSSTKKILVTALAMAFAPLACAGPIGGQVMSGAGSISQSGSVTTIQQTSQNLSLDWQSFNIAKQETVNFQQPSTAAVAVNRILDTTGTQILGHLKANGQIFLINPNGVLFGQGSQINVGGLVASTLDLNDATLNNNATTFSGSGTGSIINQGTINAAIGGYVALLGNQVSNQGAITAQLGTVALGAGSAATLTFSNNSLVNIQVSQSTLNNLAANGGLLQADGGKVLVTACAKNALLASVVNNTGIIEARTVENHQGTIILLGGMSAGTVNIGGTLDASASVPSPSGGGLGRGSTPSMNNENGGNIETSAAHVNVANNAKVTTAAPSGLAGTWLIDPVDFTIAATGGDMTGAILSSSLSSGNVSILSSNGATGTAGNINVNDVVSWSANKLTLNAQNNININANLNGSGTASLALEYGQGTLAAGNTSNYFLNTGTQVNLSAGNNFSTKLGSDGSTVVYSVITILGTANTSIATSLQGIKGKLAGNYVLGANIDAAAISTGTGFTPIGTATTAFSGTFDGLGHTISNLTIKRPTIDYVGLFGHVAAGSVIRNVGLVGGSVSGNNYVGGLVGVNTGTVSNSYSTVSVSSVNGQNVAGLVGTNNGTISNSYATGNVSGNTNAGGLVGQNAGLINTSFATGSVTGSAVSSVIGGLAGNNLSGGVISNSYATGGVNGFTSVGGLVGRNIGGMVNNSYATGSVSGSSYLGGLVGYNWGSVNNSYATGSVSGSNYVGGLIGNNNAGTISNSFWNTTTSGQSLSAGGIGMSTAQMQVQANFTSVTVANGITNPGWDFANSWVMYEGYSYPLLMSFMMPLTITASSLIKIYDGQVYSGGSGVTYSVNPNSNLLGSLTYSGSSQGAMNAGSYAITLGGLYSGQQGYIVSYVNGTLKVNPATLSVSGVTANNKVYDGTTLASLSGNGTLSGVIGSDVVALTQSGNFASKNVGTSIVVTPTLSGASASNYTLADLAADITPRVLVLNGTTKVINKVYDGTTTAALGGSTLSGVIVGDTVTHSATFASKNAGNGIAVTAMLTGGSAGNYALIEPVGLSANITPLAITVSAIGANKVYDTLANDVVTLNSTGVIAGDDLTFSYGSATFANKNAGTNKTVSVKGITGSGLDAGNYTLNNTTTTQADISAATLTVSGSSVADMIYNGKIKTKVLNGILNGVLGTDSVNLKQSGVFSTKNAGNGIAVTLTDTLSGAAAKNYILVQPTGLVGNIIPKKLTVSGTKAASKVYDATNAATVSGGVLHGLVKVNGIIDTVGLVQAGLFSDKNAGAGKVVTYSNTLTGANIANYTLVGTKYAVATAKAKISQFVLAVDELGLTIDDKAWDGTKTANVYGSTICFGTGPGCVFAGDNVTFQQMGTFNSANITPSTGVSIVTYKYILNSDIHAGGTLDSANYSLDIKGGKIDTAIIY